MQHSEQINELAAALSRAQAAIRPVAFDATNPFLKNKYASHGALLEAIRPHLEPNGLAVVQLPISEGERIGVETIVTHSSGQWISERFTLPFGQEKGKSPAQVAGSLTSYCKRYGLPGVFALYGEDDQDGNAPDLHGQAPEPGESFESATPEPPSPTPAALPVDVPADALTITGFVKAVNSKPTKKEGKFRYGILIVETPDAPAGVWLNTFDTTDAGVAEKLKGKKATCLFTEGQYGKDLVRHGIVAA